MKIFTKVLAVFCALSITATMIPPSLVAFGETKANEIMQSEGDGEIEPENEHFEFTDLLEEEAIASGTNEESPEEDNSELIKVSEENIPINVDNESTSGFDNLDLAVLSDENVLMSGKCGKNATWNLDEFGKLTISGTGEMYNYDSEGNQPRSPWYLREDIKKVVIEDGITTIGWSSFYGCKNLKLAVIPDSVTDIGFCSFYYCSSLTFVTIPKSVTEIGNYAFNGSGLKSVYYKGSKEEWDDIETYVFNQTLRDSSKHFNEVGKLAGTIGGIERYCTDEFRYHIYENEITIERYIGKNEAGIVVPDELDGYPVVHISLAAFDNISNLVSLYFPKSIAEITNQYKPAASLVEYCPNFENLFVDESNEKYCDVDGVVYTKDEKQLIFYPEGKKDDTYAVLDNVESLAIGSFHNNRYIRKVILPIGLREIIWSAFHHCTNLRELNIPDSVVEIGLFAFEDTDNLGEIVDGTRYIDDCLVDAPDKTDIIVRNGTRIISGTAFEWDQYEGRDLVENIELPKSIISVNSGAFYWCKNLKDVYYRGTEDDWNKIKIGDTNNDPLFNAQKHYSSDKISFSRDTNYAIIGDDDAVIRLNYTGSDGINTIECAIADESIAEITKTDVIKSPGDDPVWGDNPFGKNTSANIYVKGIKSGLTRLVVTINGTETSFTDVIADDKNLIVGCNRTDLNVINGEYFLLNACVSSRKDTYDSNIKFEYNESELKKEQDFYSNEYSRIALKALKPGNFEIKVTDEISGMVKTIPITVRERYGNSYTIYSITESNDALKTNFVHNGLFVDSYSGQWKKNQQGKECINISFDVYNNRPSYGIVEVYNEKNELINAELISPAEGLPTDAWTATIGNLSKLGKDVLFSVRTGEWFSYRQETGYSTHTSIKLTDIPKGGSIKITNDPLASDVLFLVDASDIILQYYGVYKDTKKFTKSLREEIIEVTMKEFVSKLNLWSISVKSVIKSVKDKIVDKVISPETLAEILTSDDVIQVLKDVILNIDYSKVITGFAKSDLEKVLLEAPGVPREIKLIMDTAFTAYGAINFYGTINAFNNSLGGGVISIIVPNNSSMSFNNVSLKGAFDDHTSLEVFQVKFDGNVKSKLPSNLSTIPDDYPFVYNITLYRNGQEVQPDGDISVSINIPEELLPYKKYLNVYRLNDNNTSTLLDTTVDGNKIVFVTNHLSEYVLIPSQLSNIVTFPDNVVVTRNNIALNNGDEIAEGDNLIITANAPIGYRLNSLTVNGKSIPNGDRYVVGKENVVIAVNFEINSINRPKPSPSVDPGKTSGSYETSYTPENDNKDTENEDNDNKPFIPNIGINGWDGISEQINKSSGETLTINMNGTTILPARILQTIKKNNIKLTLIMDERFSWSINGKDVEKTDRDIDMQVTLNADGIPEEAVKALAGEREYLTLSLKHNGDFGFNALLVINTGTDYDNKSAELYWYNNGVFKSEDDCKVKYGKAVLEFSHASDWAIVFGENLNNSSDFRKTNSNNIENSNNSASNSNNETLTDTFTPAEESSNTTSAGSPDNTISIGKIVINNSGNSNETSENTVQTTTSTSTESDSSAGDENPYTGVKMPVAVYVIMLSSAAVCVYTRKSKGSLLDNSSK